MSDPDRTSELAALSEEAHAFFVQKHAARERALRLSRAVGQQSANAIRSAHRHEFEESRALLKAARGAVAEMREVQETHPDVYYAGFVQDSQKEYVEAHATLAFITRGPLPRPHDLGVAYPAYLNGLGEAIGEMRRFILDSLRHSDSSRCEELLDLMDRIYTQLFTMDFPEAITGGLRRTTDAMRGILERTRGDLTTALGQRTLEQRLARLWERLEGRELESQAHVKDSTSAQQQLQRMGFQAVGPNPAWYSCVVISMLMQPGVKREIDARAHRVAETLRWTKDEPNGNHSSPCFHFGHAATRNYFMRNVKNPRVGANHSLDQIEPYCYTHRRSWRNSESGGYNCTKYCEYGLRILG